MTELPDPAAGLADSWEFELGVADRFAPWLAEAETLDWPAERWRSELVELVRTIREVDGRPDDGADAAVAVGLLLTARLPAAKAALIADGLDPAAVEAMPAGQVIAVRQSRALRRLLDAYRVAAALPPRQALAAAAEAEELLKQSVRAGGPASEPIPLAATMLPALRQALDAGLRVRTDLAALRVVEALRAHAAATGAFPAALGEITAVPVPENPRTGAAFPYRLEDGTAVLEVDRSEVAEANRVLRLTLRGGE